MTELRIERMPQRCRRPVIGAGGESSGVERRRSVD